MPEVEMGSSVLEISFLQVLYAGNWTLTEEEEFKGLSSLISKMAGLVVLTNPPFPNVNQHWINDAAVNWIHVPPLDTATSIPIYPTN